MSDTKEGAQQQGQRDATQGLPPAAPSAFPTNTQYQTYQNQYDYTKKQSGQ